MVASSVTGKGPGSAGGGQDSDVWGRLPGLDAHNSSAMIFMIFFICKFENKYSLSKYFLIVDVKPEGPLEMLL